MKPDCLITRPDLLARLMEVFNQPLSAHELRIIERDNKHMEGAKAVWSQPELHPDREDR